MMHIMYHCIRRQAIRWWPRRSLDVTGESAFASNGASLIPPTACLDEDHSDDTDRVCSLRTDTPTHRKPRPMTVSGMLAATRPLGISGDFFFHLFHQEFSDVTFYSEENRKSCSVSGEPIDWSSCVMTV